MAIESNDVLFRAMVRSANRLRELIDEDPEADHASLYRHEIDAVMDFLRRWMAGEILLVDTRPTDKQVAW